MVAQGQRQLLWGDTHLHSNVSADAFTLGSRMDPATAYRFAMGLPVTNEAGQTVRLRAPLIFLRSPTTPSTTACSHWWSRDPRLADWPLGQQMGDLMHSDQPVELAMLFADAIQSSDPALRTRGRWSKAPGAPASKLQMPPIRRECSPP